MLQSAFSFLHELLIYEEHSLDRLVRILIFLYQNLQWF